MKPRIDSTRFGSIVIEGKTFRHDVQIGLDGKVSKRKKKLSKAVYGTSHIISLDETKHIYQKGAERLIVGSGQHGLAKLSKEAVAFFQGQGCHVELLPTGEAIAAWREHVQPFVRFGRLGSLEPVQDTCSRRH